MTVKAEAESPDTSNFSDESSDSVPRYSDWLKVYVKTANTPPEINVLKRTGSSVSLSWECDGEENGYLVNGEKKIEKIGVREGLLQGSKQYSIKVACIYSEIAQTDENNFLFETAQKPVPPNLELITSSEVILQDSKSKFDFEIERNTQAESDILSRTSSLYPSSKYPKIEPFVTRSSKLANRYKFDTLEPDWLYEFRYREIVDDVTSTDWSTVSYRTAPAPPKINIIEIGGDYIELNAPPNVKLVLQYADRDISSRTTTLENGGYTFGNLSSETHYSICAKRLISSTTSSDTTIVSVSTATNPPKLDLGRTVVTSGEFNLVWNFDESAAEDSDLEYILKIVGPRLDKQEYVIGKDFTVSELYPQTVYKVYLQANYKTLIIGGNEGDENYSVSTKTKVSYQNLKTLPTGPAVKVLKIFTRHFEVNWTPIVDSKLTHYSTELRKCGNTRIRPVVRTTNLKSFTFIGLLPNTKYCAKVFGQMRNGLKTEAGEVEVTTAPEAPDIEWLDSRTRVSDNDTVDATLQFSLLGENVKYYHLSVDLENGYSREVIFDTSDYSNWRVEGSFGFSDMNGLALKTKYPTEMYAVMKQVNTRTENAATILSTPRSKRCYICNGGSTFDYDKTDPTKGCRNLNTCYQKVGI